MKSKTSLLGIVCFCFGIFATAHAYDGDKEKCLSEYQKQSQLVDQVVAGWSEKDKEKYKSYISWTKENKFTPKSYSELIAQHVRGQKCEPPNEKFLSLYQPFKINYEKLARLVPNEYGTAPNFARCHDALVQTRNVNSKLVELECKILEKDVLVNLKDAFALWEAYPETISLLKPEYIERGYHPMSHKNLPGSVYFKALRDWVDFDLQLESYESYVKNFNSDPMNKVKKLQPLDFVSYTSESLFKVMPGALKKLEEETLIIRDRVAEARKYIQKGLEKYTINEYVP